MSVDTAEAEVERDCSRHRVPPMDDRDMDVPVSEETQPYVMSDPDGAVHAYSTEEADRASIVQILLAFGRLMFDRLVSRPDLAAIVGEFAAGITSSMMTDASMTLRGAMQTIQSCLRDLRTRSRERRFLLVSRLPAGTVNFYKKNQGKRDHSQEGMNGGSGSRYYHTVTAFGNKLVMFGGIRDNQPLNDVHIFDAISRLWVLPEVLGSSPSPRYGHSAVLLDEERILVFGGQGVASQDMVWFLEVDTPYVRKQSQLLGKTVVAWSKGIFGDLPMPVVICGPSGVGKGTLIGRLTKDFPTMFGFSVSHTTRLPRNLEKSGVHYHFTERHLMELAIQEGKFLESADVHGNLYGTSIAAVEAVANAGKRCILDIDVQGAQAVRKSGLNATFIFLAPPSLEHLESRLRGRGTETEEQIQKRLRNARVELEHGKNCLLFDHYVVNDNLEQCYSEIKRLLGLELGDFNGIEDGFDNQGVLLKPRYGHSAAVIGGDVFIFGGVGLDMDGAITIIETSTLVGGAPGQTTRLRVSSSGLKHEMSNGSAMSNTYLKVPKENGRL
ncbi:hypothetical protein L7F22_064392 [Adiantum nelumboides]|nr:hypothetical protein [Adiantum nelumboides]